MLSRREFLGAVALGAAASRLRAGPPPDQDPPATGDVFRLLEPGGPLLTAAALGRPMIDEPLRGQSASHISAIQGDVRWSDEGAAAETETLLAVRGLPTPGNRSTYARIDFSMDSPRSAIELRLVTTHALVQGRRLSALRARIAAGTFAVLGLDNELVAGDPEKVVFTPRPGQWHTLELVTFQKSVQARIRDGVRISLPDRLRFIPGDPALLLAPAGRSIVRARRWEVAAIGPRHPILGAIGDSITAGLQHGPEAVDYVRLTTLGLGQRYDLNAGSGGANMIQDRLRFPYEIAPFRPRLVWIESGSNDLNQGRSAESIHADLMATAGQVIWGGKPVLSTVISRAALSPAAQIERRKLNERIRRGPLPYVDRARVCQTPGREEQLRPDFDSGDGVHPNAAGSSALAAAALSVFRRLI